MGSRYSRDRYGDYSDRGGRERDRYPERTGGGYGDDASPRSSDNYFGAGRQGFGDGLPSDDYGNMGSAWRSSGSYGRMGGSDRGGRSDYRSPSGFGRDDYRTGYDQGDSRTWDDEVRGGYGRGTNLEGYSGQSGYSSGSSEYGSSRYGSGSTGYGRSGYGSRSGDTDRGYGGGRDDRGWWDKASDEVASWFGDDEAERRRRMDESRGEYRGEHRGKGPRNYKRSDDRIKEDINDRLTDDYVLDASDIDVEVSDGDVILTGSVNSRYEKRHAEDIAEEVSGVKNVENRIRVSDSRSSSNYGSSQYASSYMSGTGNTGTSSTGSGDTTTGSAETGSENRSTRSAGGNS